MNDSPAVVLVDAAGTFLATATDPLRIDPTWTTPQPVTIAAAIPLPVGAATSANQATEIAALASIDAKLTAPLAAVVVSSALPLGAATEATLLGVLTTAAFQARINVLGQNTMVGSTPVVIASDQSTLSVTIASVPLPTGAAISALQTTGNASLASIDAKLPAALVGGRLDENVGAWLGSTTPTVGQKAMAASLPVAIASDQAAFPTTWADGPRVTYLAGRLGVASAALTTDIFTITGSATKLVRVLRMEIFGIATTATAAQVQLVRRSTANTGGTSTPVVAVPADSTDPPATATILAYTANPVLGTLVGAVRAGRINLNLLASIVTPGHLAWEFGVYPGTKAEILRGVNEVLAVNMNGVTVAGGSMSFCVVWTEE